MVNMIQNMVGMGNLTDQVIATDYLIASKSAIKNYAAAIAEAATPEVTNTLRRQMDVAINAHERITNYMMDKGYYQAYNPQEQIRMDVQAADVVINIGQQG